MPTVGGIHHVTCIAGDPQENVDFYAGILGMRMVKRSVNQDDPGTYHLFYADGGAHPGSDVTFFPWPHMGPGRQGTGLVNEVAFAVPPGSLAWWRQRLEREGLRVSDGGLRMGDAALTFADHHGLPLALVETRRGLERPFAPWERSGVPAPRQVRGIHSVRVLQQNAEPTLQLAERVLGMSLAGREDGWDRYQGRDAWCGFLEARTAPELPRGEWGVGTVHHVAWRVKDEAEQVNARADVQKAGLRPTSVIDRFWFTSVYFREPGGVLFELATDGPGFGARRAQLVGAATNRNDSALGGGEPVDKLGESLVVPPWLGEHRA